MGLEEGKKAEIENIDRNNWGKISVLGAIGTLFLSCSQHKLSSVHLPLPYSTK